MIYRQGDVLLVRKQRPAKAKAVKHEGRIILAHGEATGHAHVIASPGVKVFEHEGTRWIRVPKAGAVLTHEEHGAIALTQGEYEIRIQREYTPEEIRNVKD